MAGPFTTEWFYNDLSGSVISEPAIVGFAQGHFPHWHGPFASKQAALDFYQNNKAAHPGWKAPTGFAGAVGNTVAKGAQTAAGAVAGALTKTFGLSGGPTSQNFWIRAAEFLVGTGLILVGLAHLVSNTSVGKAANQIAKKAALL